MVKIAFIRVLKSNQYVNLEVPSAKTDGSYFQNVPLKLIKTPEVTVNVEGQSFDYYKDFISLSGGESFYIYKDIILVGYGITDDNYNDYESIDVTGKIVVAIGGEPKGKDDNYLVSGTTVLISIKKFHVPITIKSRPLKLMHLH